MSTPDNRNRNSEINDDALSEEIRKALLHAQEDGEALFHHEPEERVDFASPVNRDELEATSNKTEQIKPTLTDVDDYVYSTPKRYRKRSKNSNSKNKNKKRKNRIKKTLIIILSVVLTLIIALLGTGIYWYFSGKGSLLNNKNLNINVDEVSAEIQDSGNYIVTEDGKKYKYNENITSILCMGVDENQEEGIIGVNSAADAIFVVALDTVTGKTSVINVSRDIITDINVYSVEGNFIETKKDQLALAYSYGDGDELSCENQVDAVRNIFYNIPINSYVSINLDGLETVNDYIGGVTVVSPETVSRGNKYFFVEGQQYTLWGEQAHSFIRARNFDQVDGNNGRIKRQMVYLQSFADKVVANAKQDISSIVDLYNVAIPYVCTNLDVNKVTYLAVNALQANYGQFDILSVPSEKIIEGDDEQAEFYIDEEAFFNDVFLKVFYEPVE